MSTRRGPRPVWRLATVAGVLAATAFAAFPASSSANCSGQSPGGPPCQLNYYGGPIMPSVRTVLVLWGTHVNSTYSSTDQALLGDLAADSGTTGNIFAILPEYSTKGVTPQDNGASSNQTLAYSQSYGGVFTIAPAQCNGSAPSCTVDETAIQTELKNQIAAGHLPAPSGDGLTTAYIVVFPPNVTVTSQALQSGFDFCVHQGHTPLNTGTEIVYGLLPDDFGNGGCGSGTAVQNETTWLTYELAGMITDPDFNVTTPAARPTAWLDPNDGPIGQLCIAQPVTNVINGHSYTVQKQWSNRLGDCASTSTYQSPAGDFTANTAGEPVSFAGSGSTVNGDGTISSYSWSFGDGSSGNGATPSHAYAAAGTYTVTLTITDNLGFIKRVSHDITAPAPPSTGGGGGGGGQGAAPSITLIGSPSTTLHGTSVLVVTGNSVKCPAGAGPCLVSVVARATLPAGVVNSAGKRKLKTAPVGSGKTTVAAGSTKPVTFKLNRKGARLLRKLKRMKVKVVVTVRYGTLAPVKSTRTITLKQPKRRH